MKTSRSRYEFRLPTAIAYETGVDFTTRNRLLSGTRRMNLVIFKTNALGDTVVFLPVVQTLRQSHPRWRIRVVTHPGLRDLFVADIMEPDLLLIGPDELRQSWRTPWRIRPWVRWIRAAPPDAVLVGYDQSTVAHWLARLSGARIRVGAELNLRHRRRGLTERVEWDGRASVAEWNWQMACRLAAALGEAALPAAPPAPDLGHLVAGTARHEHRIVIHASSKREMTRWPTERFIELAGRLAKRGNEVVWIDAPEVVATLPAGIHRARTGSVAELVRLIASAALFVGNNSGPMHVANATRTPIVAVTGPPPPAWDPAWHRDRVRVLRRPELACQPCDRLHSLPSACANAAEPLACLRRWSVDDVLAACDELLPLGRA